MKMNAFEDTLNCCICMTLKTNLKLIDPCGHSLCEECIGSLNVRQCPIDKKPILKTFPNFHSKNLIEEASKCL